MAVISDSFLNNNKGENIMEKKSTNSIKLSQKKLCILFAGDMDRGEPLRGAVKMNGWEFKIETDIKSMLNGYVACQPDFVILDGFPESDSAKSAYYHFRCNDKISFIALNDSPEAMKFIHLSSLSFLKMIHRDSEPETVINEIYSMLRSNDKLHFGYSNVCCLEKTTARKGEKIFCKNRYETCC